MDAESAKIRPVQPLRPLHPARARAAAPRVPSFFLSKEGKRLSVGARDGMTRQLTDQEWKRVRELASRSRLAREDGLQPSDDQDSGGSDTDGLLDFDHYGRRNANGWLPAYCTCFDKFVIVAFIVTVVAVASVIAYFLKRTSGFSHFDFVMGHFHMDPVG